MIRHPNPKYDNFLFWSSENLLFHSPKYDNFLFWSLFMDLDMLHSQIPRNLVVTDVLTLRMREFVIAANPNLLSHRLSDQRK